MNGLQSSVYVPASSGYPSQSYTIESSNRQMYRAFMATIGHDIKNALTLVKGNTYVLLRRGDYRGGDEATKCLDQIKTLGHELEILIDQTTETRVRSVLESDSKDDLSYEFDRVTRRLLNTAEIFRSYQAGTGNLSDELSYGLVTGARKARSILGKNMSFDYLLHTVVEEEKPKKRASGRELVVIKKGESGHRTSRVGRIIVDKTAGNSVKYGADLDEEYTDITLPERVVPVEITFRRDRKGNLVIWTKNFYKTDEIKGGQGRGLDIADFFGREFGFSVVTCQDERNGRGIYATEVVIPKEYIRDN